MGQSEVGGYLRHLIDAEFAAVRPVLPTFPTGRTELASEVEALDMIRRFRVFTAVMLGD